ncbi:MAG: hypothetical protein M1818_007961 [Claussenomyces sp. TS43310]|nr:MAG: hypothetical protein M1818_007961 [Claussenomyces sp. TS43310]
MATESGSPRRELTPALPQKRVLEDDHQPAVSSPLNPSFKDEPAARVARAKKESLKKREAKGGSHAPESSRATPDPKSPRKEKTTLAPMRYKLPPPKLSDFEAPRSPVFTPHHTITTPDGTIEFNETSEHVHNKRNYRYTHCIADPAFPQSQFYRQSEAEPFGARISFEDTAGHMQLDESGRHVTTDKGFRMAKANVCAREGRWYWECKITQGITQRNNEESSPHVRMGFARREATLDAPVGYGCYSYGLRDTAGQKVFASRPKDFFPPGESIEEGDVIGLEINLPSDTLHRKVVEGDYNPAVDLEDDEVRSTSAPDIIVDRIPIRFKSHVYFEQIDYSPVKELEMLMNPSPDLSAAAIGAAAQKPSPTHASPALRTLPHSSIKIYKNGNFMGTAFTDLLAFLPPASKPQESARDGLDDGMLGYYPAISVFRGGAAEINLGPDFWYPPPVFEDNDDEVDMIGSDQPAPKTNKLRAMSERYDEQIVESLVQEMVDEVCFWEEAGGANGVAMATSMQRSASDAAGLGPGMPSEEIKELVQDDE